MNYYLNCDTIADRNIIVGRNIQLVRIFRGYSQAQLSEKCSMSRPTISKLEHGSIKDISLDQLLIISEALDTDIIRILSPNPLCYEGEPLGMLINMISTEGAKRIFRHLHSILETADKENSLLEYFMNILKIMS